MCWDGINNGEIVLSGNTLFAGYYRNPEATEAAFHNGGFHTGNIAVVNPNEYFLKYATAQRILSFLEVRIFPALESRPCSTIIRMSVLLPK